MLFGIQSWTHIKNEPAGIWLAFLHSAFLNVPPDGLTSITVPLDQLLHMYSYLCCLYFYLNPNIWYKSTWRPQYPVNCQTIINIPHSRLCLNFEKFYVPLACFTGYLIVSKLLLLLIFNMVDFYR